MRRLLVPLLFVLASGLTAQQGYFWDDPEYLMRQGARFPTAVDNGKTAAAFWQERRQTTGWPQAFLSVTVRNSGETGWTTRKNVLGPFTQVGAEVLFYSVLLTKAGVFWVAVLDDNGQLILYRSDDGAASFREDARLQGTGSITVPKLFLGADDEPLLTVNQAIGLEARVALSRRTGGAWSPLKTVTTAETQRQSRLPSIAVAGDRLVMVFQSQITGRRFTNQIYRQDSLDGGSTWSAPERLSNFADELSDDVDGFSNQRPTVYSTAGRLFVTWERQLVGTQSMIEVTSYSSEGKRLSNTLLTTAGYSALNPLFYTFRDRLYLAWFDNRNETYDLWQSVWDTAEGWGAAAKLSQDTGNSVFGQPAKLGDDLYFFWQSNFADNAGVVMLKPDRRADPPQIRPVNFKLGAKTNKPDFNVEIVYPRDISGVKAFNALLTQDEAAAPSHDRQITSSDRQYGVTVPQEGVWYLAVSVLDLAGNWSDPARIPLTLKTTPPGPVLFDSASTDPRGFLTANTFQLSWKPTTDDAVSYSWRLSRLGDALTPGLLASMKAPEPLSTPLGTQTSAGGNNFEDGLWGLAVAAFDEAGNRGPVSTQFFRLNKFRPSTIIQFVDTKQDAFGRVEIAIHGRGFTAGGNLDHVYIDRDGKLPWDYDLGPGRFHLDSDRLVDGIKVEGLAEGVYRVGVNHPDRGTVFTGPILRVEPTGTVKIGDYRNLDQTVWEFFEGITFFFSVHALYFWAIMAVLLLIALGSGRLLVVTWTERVNIDHRAEALFADNPDKWARRAGRTAMKTKGLSLSFKFAASILGLTATVVLMLSLTLAFFITENSQLTLGTALMQRTQVLLDSLATGARTYVLSQNYPELGLSVAQISAMPEEAIYATITGPSTEAKPGNSFVYASNDPSLVSKLDTPALRAGISRIQDAVEPTWEAFQAELNRNAEAAVGDLARQSEALTAEDKPLADKLNRTREEEARFQANENQNAALKRQIVTKLAEVAGKARSVPEFIPANLLSSQEKRYLFYQPYFYLRAGDPTYVRGLVRIEVSSAKIEGQIAESRNQLIQVTAIIAALALTLGLIGAFILSALTLNPIRKLAAGVAKIRDTYDKTELEGHTIDVKTRDELEDLASTVNQMTKGLVDGAKRTQDLTKGKVEQKTLFIPLDKDGENQKLTTFHRDLADIEVFAYYEGAKLVSGDLYEFRQLDTQDGRNKDSPWYGIMKGDVSGKGVEAGMVMAIAAMFVTTFFRRWTAARDAKDTKVQSLLYQVNDTIEPILAEAGRGLFVALNVGILNAKTGALRFSQAGDNLLHIWRGNEQKFESVDLKKTVSVGAMPSDLHNIKYENRDLRIGSGDTLLYFTDGIEESQSAYRNASWQPVAYFDPEDESTLTVPGDRKQVPVFEGGPMRDIQAIATEDFGPERIEHVITAFFHREVYELKKKYNPDPSVTYHFDFRSCDGSAKQLVTALISIDRIFRLVPDPTATEEDHINVDRVQDEFLKVHFMEYSRYFKDGKPDPEDTAYMVYTHLKEDDQFDDLTLLAIQKK